MTPTIILLLGIQELALAGIFAVIAADLNASPPWSIPYRLSRYWAFAAVCSGAVTGALLGLYLIAQ